MRSGEVFKSGELSAADTDKVMRCPSRRTEFVSCLESQYVESWIVCY